MPREKKKKIRWESSAKRERKRRGLNPTAVAWRPDERDENEDTVYRLTRALSPLTGDIQTLQEQFRVLEDSLRLVITRLHAHDDVLDNYSAVFRQQHNGIKFLLEHCCKGETNLEEYRQLAGLFHVRIPEPPRGEEKEEINNLNRRLDAEDPRTNGGKRKRSRKKRGKKRRKTRKKRGKKRRKTRKSHKKRKTRRKHTMTGGLNKCNAPHIENSDEFCRYHAGRSTENNEFIICDTNTGKCVKPPPPTTPSLGLTMDQFLSLDLTDDL